MDVFLDVNIFLSVLLNEPERERILEQTTGKSILSSSVVIYEAGNALISMYKSKRLTEKELCIIFSNFQKIPIRLIEPDIEKSLKLACQFNHYAYDAYYLETALRLKKPLMTLDHKMKETAKKLKIEIIEVVLNESI